MLRDYSLPPAHGGAPDAAVIFLHGLGDRGDGGLLDVGRLWQRALPGCEFLCPDAPFPFDMAPPDFGGRQWFSLTSFTPENILKGARAAAPFLNSYIDQVLATRKLTPKRLVLVGFSQGTIMALYVAPRRPEAVACIVGYSGLLTGGDELEEDIKSSPPVLLVHGQQDEVVPFTAMAQAQQMLARARIPVTTLSCPLLGHGLDDAGVTAGLKFLRQYLL